MNKNIIVKKILNIINNKLKISYRELSCDDIDKDLFGKDIRLLARDAMVLFCEIENEFDIKINEQMFKKHGFQNVRSISNMIESIYKN